MKLLIFSLSNIGDIVLTTGVVEALRDQYPESTIDIVVSETGVGLFAHDERIRQTIVYDKHATWSAKYRFMRRLADEKYDKVIDLKQTFLPLLLMKSLALNYATAIPKGVHARERHLARLRRLGITTYYPPRIRFSDADTWRVKELLTAAGCYEPAHLVVIAPGAKSRWKCWPAASFTRLIERLHVERGYTIVLAGNMRDQKDTREIEHLSSVAVYDLTGKTNLTELAALSAQADLVISNDSAPMHIALAVATPVVALFGPTDPAEYGPLETEGLVICADIACRPCKEPSCRYDHECMTEMDADEVYRVISDYLSRKNTQ